MRLIRMMGLCLMSVFAMAAVAAATASATLPEWGGCEAAPVGKGKYRDSACVDKVTLAAKKAEGDYEWYTGENFGWVHQRERGLDHGYGIEEYNFSPVEVGPTTFETVAGKKVECAGSGESPEESNRIQLEAPKRVKSVLLTFLGCHESTGPGEEGAECHSPGLPGGAGPGEPYEGLVTDATAWENEEALKGKLVFVEGKGTENPKVGLSLTSFYKPGEEGPFGPTNGHLFEVVCEGPHGIGTVWIGGNKKGKNAVISLITPVDEMVGEGESSTAFSETFKGTNGIQEPSAREGGHEEILYETLENETEKSAWNSLFTDPPEEGAPPIEIKARP